MKKLLLFALLILIYSSIKAQSDLIWSNPFNTNLHNYYTKQYQPKVIVENDIIKIIGVNNIDNNQKLQVVEYDLNGELINTIDYSLNISVDDTIEDFLLDGDNNIYVVKKEYLEFYKSKIVIQKYDYNSNLLWHEEIQSSDDISFRPQDINILNNNQIFIIGQKETDYPLDIWDDTWNTISIPMIFSFSQTGTILWETELNEIDFFSSRILQYDNNIVLFGHSSPFYSMMKIDIDGTKTVYSGIELLNGTGSLFYDTVLVTNELEFIVASGEKYRISKIGSNGENIWSEYYGTNLPSNVHAEEIRSIILDDNQNIYVTGRHGGEGYDTSDYTNCDILTIKYDSEGQIIWENRYVYGGNNCDIGSTIVKKNGFIYVGGRSQRLGIGTDYDYVLLKIDEITGENTTHYRYNGSNSGTDVISSLYIFDDGQIALTGLSGIENSYNWITQKLSDVTTTLSLSPNQNNKYSIYPIPVNDFLQIENNNMFEIRDVKVYSIIGKLVLSPQFEQTSNQLDLSSLNNGTYLLKIDTEFGYVTRKIIKMSH